MVLPVKLGSMDRGMGGELRLISVADIFLCGGGDILGIVFVAMELCSSCAGLTRNWKSASFSSARILFLFECNIDRVRAPAGCRCRSRLKYGNPASGILFIADVRRALSPLPD